MNQEQDEIINVVLVIYMINNVINVDLFMNGVFKDTKIMKDIIREFINDGVFKSNEKYHVLYGQVKGKNVKWMNKINRIRKALIEVYDDELCGYFINVNDLVDNRNLIKFVKRMCLRRNDGFDETLIHFNDDMIYQYDSVMSYDLDNEYIIKVNKKIEQNNHKMDSVNEQKNMTKQNDNKVDSTNNHIKNVDLIHRMFDFKNAQNKLLSITYDESVIKVLREIHDRRDVLIDGEMERSIKLLKKIGFIHENDYYIYKDRVILKTPFVHAWGDWIKHRNKRYVDKDNSLEYCISRLNIRQIWCDHHLF